VDPHLLVLFFCFASSCAGTQILGMRHPGDVLIADAAAQNECRGEYKSVGEAIVLIGTIRRLDYWIA